jgi:hypothetical protein
MNGLCWLSFGGYKEHPGLGILDEPCRKRESDIRPLDEKFSRHG